MRDAILSNIFMIIVVVSYSIFIFFNMYKFYKYSGEKVKTYKHRSTTKTMGYVIAVLGLFYAFMFILSKEKNVTVTMTFILFTYFVIMVSFISIKDIVLYENGIYYSGKFVRYIDMKDIEKIGKKGVHINVFSKKSLNNGLYMNKIDDETDFIKTIKKNIKLARKHKKMEEKNQ